MTIVNRSPGLLRAEDDEISERFTEIAARPLGPAARRRWSRRSSGTTAGSARTSRDGSTVEADLLLVATGRRSNADGLDLDRTGVAVDDEGVVVVDEHQRTTVDGIWALGDIANHFQLKHVSNHEARVVQHNLLHLDDPPSWLRVAARRGAERGVLQPAGRQRRPHRAGGRRAGRRPRRRAPGLRRHGVRLGDGGHHRLRQAAGRPGHRADPRARTSSARRRPTWCSRWSRR